MVVDSLPPLPILLQHVDWGIHGEQVMQLLLSLSLPLPHSLIPAHSFRASEIVIQDVKYSTFVSVLEYLYTDEVAAEISTDTAMDLFQVCILRRREEGRMTR